MADVVPAHHQPPLPRARFIVTDAPGDDAVPMDVVFVGAGPGGLAGAIELARLIRQDAEAGGDLGEIEIAVLEKADALGQHNLSGAVVDPSGMRALFPGMADEDFPFRRPVPKERVRYLTRNRAWWMPTPPPMRNHGNYIASICEVVRWLGARAEELGVHVFTGFPVESLLVEGDAVRGVRTTATGLGRDGAPGPGHQPPTDVAARVTVLSEGTRGSLTQAWRAWQEVPSPNPPIYALGVKELWETKQPLDAVVHTMGWPVPRTAFGGTFMYPLEDKLVALGLVVGLDYRERDFDIGERMQLMKRHPFFKRVLDGGELVEWGAKTIPEGGWYSLPERLTGDGLLLLGDAAGFVDVPSLKGIHYAMHSGILAARAIFAALEAGETSRDALSGYDEAIRQSVIARDLRKRRNMRLAFRKGFVRGAFKSGLMTITGGRFPGWQIEVESDAQVPRVAGEVEPLAPDGVTTFGKVEGVYKAGNTTRDDIPSHLLAPEHPPADLQAFYAHLCPAGVYEPGPDGLVVNAPNCVDCKATDVVGPRWSPREGGSGPRYKRM
jgi:electron-transferring-flavoprotein dehydrogenase